MNRIEQIEKIGTKAQGKQELLKYLNGGKLTLRQAVKAKCYECEAYYQDGKVACEITTCPLQPFNPYREGGVQKSRVVSETSRNASRDRLMKSKIRAGNTSTR